MMADKREIILRKCDEETNYLLIGSDESVIGYDGELQTIYNAMDEHFKERALELLDYVGKKIKWAVEDNGTIMFWDGKEYLNKEQLFENFL